MSNNLLSTDPPRQRVQFTVRTFFGAAFLVSLFAAAAALPTFEAKVTTITFLAWLTFAGLYWIVGGTGPLVALPVGTVVLATAWMLSFPFVNHRFQAELWMAVSAAFAWGVLLSLVVVLSRGLHYVARRLRRCDSRVTHRQSPLRADTESSLSALRLAGSVLFTRLLLSVLLGTATIFCMWYPRWQPEMLAVISLVIDLPIAPFAVGVLYPHRPPDSNLVFLLVTSFLYCPLYAGTGWILGLILTRMNRPAVPTGSPTNAVPVKEESEAGSGESPEPPSA